MIALTSKRKFKARIWVCLVFIILTGAHYCFYRFSSDPRNTIALSRGLTFGCVLWTSVLLIAVWLRHGWARYFLIVLLCLAIFAFGLTALVLVKDTIEPLSEAVRMVVMGLALYAIALVPLGISRSLARYVGPRTAGE